MDGVALLPPMYIERVIDAVKRIGISSAIATTYAASANKIYVRSQQVNDTICERDQIRKEYASHQRMQYERRTNTTYNSGGRQGGRGRGRGRGTRSWCNSVKI